MHNFQGPQRVSIGKNGMLRYSPRMAKPMDFQAALQEMARMGAGRRPLPVQGGLALMDRLGDRQGGGAEIGRDLTAMIAGIRKYQDHPYREAMPSLEAIWAEGATRLLFCPPA